MSVIITKFSKDDIVEMSGVMRVMSTEMNNIKSVDGLIEKINQIELLADKTRGDIKDEAIKIIKEYCEVE